MDLIPSSLIDHCLEGYYIKISSRTRIIYWIIIGAIATGVVLLPFIYVDVSVQARGYFQSDIERQVIYTSAQGRVKFSNLKNGTRISRGDTLLIIDSESLKAQQSSILRILTETNESVHDLEILAGDTDLEQLNSRELINSKYRAEFENFKGRKGIQEQIYLKRKSEHERNQVLFQQRIIPQADYENSLFLVNSEMEDLEQIVISQKSIWQSDLIFKKNEEVKLLAELEECKESFTNRVLIAPADGDIIQSSEIQTGSIVSPGQKIAEISPTGDLIAYCYVAPDDVGLLNKGQKVRIQVDAFSYNEWGLLDAEIIGISEDMIVENGSTAYLWVKCRPDKTYLKLKNGYTAQIRKGMSLNARIFVIRRSLYNLLFDKAAKWFNPYNNKNLSD